MSSHLTKENDAKSSGLSAGDLDQIVRAAETMRFGSIEIIFHEGRVVQLEKREKIRLDPAKQKSF